MCTNLPPNENNFQNQFRQTVVFHNSFLMEKKTGWTWPNKSSFFFNIPHGTIPRQTTFDRLLDGPPAPSNAAAT